MLNRVARLDGFLGKPNQRDRRPRVNADLYEHAGHQCGRIGATRTRLALVNRDDSLRTVDMHATGNHPRLIVDAGPIVPIDDSAPAESVAAEAKDDRCGSLGEVIGARRLGCGMILVLDRFRRRPGGRRIG